MWHNNVSIRDEAIPAPGSDSVFNKYALCFHMKEGGRERGREEGKKEEDEEGRCNLHPEGAPLVWLNCDVSAHRIDILFIMNSSASCLASRYFCLDSQILQSGQ